MSVLGNTHLLMTPEGYQISRSVRLRSSASAYFNRTASTPTSGTTWTWSGWVKRGALGSNLGLFGGGNNSTTTYDGLIYSASTDTLNLFTANGVNLNLVTTQVFRDPSAWYHVVAQYDSTQATAANRAKLYINGVQVTAFGTATYPAQNTVSGGVNANGIVQVLGAIRTTLVGLPFDGYLTEVNFIDGQALTPSSFGETDAVTGVWKPKKYAGTYGTNGFYLNFSDNSNNTAATIGKDSSGNGNNWTPNNISVTAGVTYDSMLDVPTPYADGGNGRGNYCTLNPLSFNSSYCVDGNLAYAGANGTSGRASFAMPTTGKWYWEVNQVDAAVNYVGFGLADAALTNGSNVAGTTAAGMWSLYPTSTMYYALNGATGVNTGVSPPALGGCMACAYDADTGYLWFGYAASGAGSITWFASGNPSTGSNPLSTISAGRTLFPFMSSNNTTANKSAINFGQRPFNCTPPTGFKALNTQNLPEPTIKKGNQYFDVSTWTGDGSSSRAITSNISSPDFVWVKKRSASDYHVLFDTLRGLGDGNALYSNDTVAEGTYKYGYVSAVGAGSFTVAQGTSGLQYVNQSTQTYVGWQWKESASAGFDIVTYTGNGANRTIAHSLGVAPKMMIVFNRAGGYNHAVYHASIGATNYLYLDTTSASAAAASLWGNTAPTSSVFTVDTSGAVNANGSTYVNYLFSEVAGFSKFGSYTGNGSADGPFVYCGFRPRFILIKIASTTGSWQIVDTARDTYNMAISGLYPDLSQAEDTSRAFDFLSNGFKLRSATAANTSGATFIYAAFAEVPFSKALAR